MCLPVPVPVGLDETPSHGPIPRFTEEGEFTMPLSTRKLFIAALLPPAVVAGLFLTAGAAAANVAVTQVSSDPFTDAQAQHRTEVEPDTFAFGSTIVSAF